MNSALKVLAIAVIGFGCNQPSLGPDAGYCPDPNSGFTQCGASCCDDGSEQCTSAEASMCCPFAQLCANGAQCCNSTEQCLGPTGPTVTSGICCPSTSSIACNGTCCGAGQACIGATCCDNMCQTLSGPGVAHAARFAGQARAVVPRVSATLLILRAALSVVRQSRRATPEYALRDASAIIGSSHRREPIRQLQQRGLSQIVSTQ